jgi:hypothetical protein
MDLKFKKYGLIFLVALIVITLFGAKKISAEVYWDMRFALAAPSGSDSINYNRTSGNILGVGLNFENKGLLVQTQILYSHLTFPGQELVSGYLPDPQGGTELIYVTNIPMDAVERVIFLEIPVLAGWYYQGRTIRPKFSLGPSLLMLVEKTRDYKIDENKNAAKVEASFFNLGLTAALGIDFTAPAGTFFTEIRYTQLDPFDLWYSQGAVGPRRMGYIACFLGYMRLL